MKNTSKKLMYLTIVFTIVSLITFSCQPDYGIRSILVSGDWKINTINVDYTNDNIDNGTNQTLDACLSDDRVTFSSTNKTKTLGNVSTNPGSNICNPSSTNAYSNLTNIMSGTYEFLNGDTQIKYSNNTGIKIVDINQLVTNSFIFSFTESGTSGGVSYWYKIKIELVQ